MSASPFPTAAKIDLPSEDHETRRAMKVDWCPKSVSGFNSPVLVEIAQILVVGPSLNIVASHLSSGERTGCANTQLASREPDMRAGFFPSAVSGLATSISLSDAPFEVGRSVVKKSLPSAATAGFCPSGRTNSDVPPRGCTLSIRNPLIAGGAKYSHWLSGDQHAHPPPSETLPALLPSGSISHRSTFHAFLPRFT